MTAHIDAENLETDAHECDTHDLHSMQKAIRDLKFNRAGWIFTAAVSAFFNLIFIIGRVLE